METQKQVFFQTLIMEQIPTPVDLPRPDWTVRWDPYRKSKRGFSENFDEYMKEIGVSWALRKAGAMASSTTEISQEGDGVRVNTQSTVKSSNFVFPNGKAVDYTTMDGRKTKVREQFLGFQWYS